MQGNPSEARGLASHCTAKEIEQRQKQVGLTACVIGSWPRKVVLIEFILVTSSLQNDESIVKISLNENSRVPIL